MSEIIGRKKDIGFLRSVEESLNVHETASGIYEYFPSAVSCNLILLSMERGCACKLGVREACFN